MKVLNQVYLFTYKKVQMFFPGAVSEFEFQRMSHGASFNQSLFSESGLSSIGGHSVSKQVVDQMFANYNDFLSLLMQFKVMLQEQKGGQADLKYMLFRLDFNEYYHEMGLKEEEKKKRGARYDSNDEDDYMDDMGNDDYDQEDEDDDGEDDDNDDDDDDDEDDEDAKFQPRAQGHNPPPNNAAAGSLKKYAHNFTAAEQPPMPRSGSQSGLQRGGLPLRGNFK